MKAARITSNAQEKYGARRIHSLKPLKRFCAWLMLHAATAPDDDHREGAAEAEGGDEGEAEHDLLDLKTHDQDGERGGAGHEAAGDAKSTISGVVAVRLLAGQRVRLCSSVVRVSCPRRGEVKGEKLRFSRIRDPARLMGE